jgi:IclR family acetate operon transcriptional repressor
MSPKRLRKEAGDPALTPGMEQAARRPASEPAGLAGESETSGSRGGGVQSIERCFAILTEVARNPDGISLAELSKAVGLHTSTTFHLVRTMVELGAVRQDKATKRYHLGRTIFGLAASSSSEVELVTTAKPFLEDLSATSGESSHLGLPSGSEVVIAARVAGTGSFQLVERTGGLRPAHCTGLGKVLLAAMQPAHLERYLASAELKGWTPKTITDPEQLRAEIERVRRMGVGYDDAEFDNEVRCVAAPVFDFSGHVVAAVGISGPIWRMSLPRLEEMAGHVRRTAADVSRELGYRPVTQAAQ